eukprot:930600_1
MATQVQNSHILISIRTWYQTQHTYPKNTGIIVLLRIGHQQRGRCQTATDRTVKNGNIIAKAMQIMYVDNDAYMDRYHLLKRQISPLDSRTEPQKTMRICSQTAV